MQVSVGASKRHGAPISPGINSIAATATLTVPVQRLTDRGPYDCIVADGCGSKVSKAATLTIGCACSVADVAGTGLDGLLPDGIVDGSDFVAFINSFATADVAVDSVADVAGGGPDGLLPDGIIDGDDFVAFINAFSTGC